MKLVAELKDSGHQSEYLDRLRERVPAYQARNDIQLEIVQEMASALGRAEDKVNLALLKVELEGDALDLLLAKHHRDQTWELQMRTCIDAFNRLRDEAVTALWELTVHREAIGFRRDHRIHEHYPIPPRRKPIS
jgi:hypothetical protein